ncbi:adhesion G protein-coupled receptor L3 [Sarotherodon galilaeus]
MLAFSAAIGASCLLVGTSVRYKADTAGNSSLHSLHVSSLSTIVQTGFFGASDAYDCVRAHFEQHHGNFRVHTGGWWLHSGNGMKVSYCKYLETSYSCVPANESHVCFTERYIKHQFSFITHLITCEHSLAHLKCDDGQVIHVYQADFRRCDPNICSFRRDNQRLQNVKCSLPTDKVAERCNGRNSCSMRAAPSVFGDSCPNTYKYLELTYTCRMP